VKSRRVGPWRNAPDQGGDWFAHLLALLQKAVKTLP
jgi:hypothetical protein